MTEMKSDLNSVLWLPHKPENEAKQKPVRVKTLEISALLFCVFSKGSDF